MSDDISFQVLPSIQPFNYNAPCHNVNGKKKMFSIKKEQAFIYAICLDGSDDFMHTKITFPIKLLSSNKLI
jgi:hypothetical protein